MGENIDIFQFSQRYALYRLSLYNRSHIGVRSIRYLSFDVDDFNCEIVLSLFNTFVLEPSFIYEITYLSNGKVFDIIWLELFWRAGELSAFIYDRIVAVDFVVHATLSWMLVEELKEGLLLAGFTTRYSFITNVTGLLEFCSLLSISLEHLNSVSNFSLVMHKYFDEAVVSLQP